MNITYESITVGFLLSVPVIVALYVAVASTILMTIKDVMNDYQKSVTFSVPKKPVMLIQMNKSFVYKSYTCTPIAEKPMVYKSYSVEAMA